MSQDNLTAPHPTPDVLRDFNLGRLDDNDAVAVGAHLETCDTCCQVLHNLPARDGFVARLRSSGGTPASDLPTSLQRLGDYHLIREIGRGGMGVVYEAEQRSLKRRVALKVLPARTLTRDALERFRRESRLAARLHHTNIVPVFEVGQEGDVCFYAMQFIHGRSLDRLAKPPIPDSSARTGETDRFSVRSDTDAGFPSVESPAPRGGERLRPEAVARFGLQVAQALAHAHDRGVLHRDVKPSNLLLDDSGTVWVTDFGLAKAEDEGLTGTSDLLGTLRYMAPERFKGACDARADVYGLGCTLYELLTQRPAFGAATAAETVEQIHRGEPIRPRSVVTDIPADLEAVVLRAMDRDATQRYQTAAEMAEDLRRFLDGLPTRARPTGPVERLLKWVRRYPAFAALLATVAATLLGGAAVSLYFGLEARAQASAALSARDVAQTAEGRAIESENAARRLSAGLLFDHGLEMAREGKIADGLHWMVAALETSPDPDFQYIVRTNLQGWAGRTAVLRDWLPTRHEHTAISPDGHRAVTAGVGGTGAAGRLAMVQFWDLRRGQPEGEPLPTGDINASAPAFSPNGRGLVTISGPAQQYQNLPGWATRWDAVERRALGKVLGHDKQTHRAAWARDASRFVTCSADGTARVWDGEGRAVATLQHVETPSDVAIHPGGRVAVVVSSKAAQAWELDSGKRFGEPLTMPGDVTGAAFSPDGRSLLVTGGLPSKPQYARVWRWAADGSGPVGEPRTETYPTDRPAFVADGRVVPCDPTQVSHDGSRFLSVTDGVQVWDAPRQVSRPLNDHLLELTTTGRPRERLFNAFVFSADRRRVWTCGSSTHAQAWDTVTGRPVGIPVPDTATWFKRFAVSLDGRYVATHPPSSQGARSPTRLWEAATGRPVGQPLPQNNAVTTMAFRPDGRMLATGGHFHTVDLWDVPSGNRVGQPLRQEEIVLHLAFSPDSKTLAVGTWGRELRIWDVESRQLRFPPLAHPDRVYQVVFNPDGSRLVAVSSGEAWLWDVRTGKPIGTPMTYPGSKEKQWPRTQALFDPSGTVLLLPAGDGSFRLWDATTTQALGPLVPVVASPPQYFAFSPDSRLVVTGHDNGTAQVWHVPSGRPVGAPFAQVSPVGGVAFDLDGRSFFTVAIEGTIRRWPTPQPAVGDVEKLTRALQLSTRLRLDAGQAVRQMSRREWEEERRRWRETEGETDWAVGTPAMPAEWHDARAHDGEQTGASFTAHWHLERLAALRPDDWLLRARRAATFTDKERWDEAEAAYREAQARDAGEGLLEWYRSRAWVCTARKQWEAARRYLDRVVQERPEEWQVYLQRASVQARLGNRAAQEEDLEKAVALGADAAALAAHAQDRGLQKD